MERYIGLDVHAASSTAVVIDARGKRVGSPHVLSGTTLFETRIPPDRGGGPRRVVATVTGRAGGGAGLGAAPRIAGGGGDVRLA